MQLPINYILGLGAQSINDIELYYIRKKKFSCSSGPETRTWLGNTCEIEGCWCSPCRLAKRELFHHILIQLRQQPRLIRSLCTMSWRELWPERPRRVLYTRWTH